MPSTVAVCRDLLLVSHSAIVLASHSHCYLPSTVPQRAMGWVVALEQASCRTGFLYSCPIDVVIPSSMQPINSGQQHSMSAQVKASVWT